MCFFDFDLLLFIFFIYTPSQYSLGFYNFYLLRLPFYFQVEVYQSFEAKEGEIKLSEKVSPVLLQLTLHIFGMLQCDIDFWHNRAFPL